MSRCIIGADWETDGHHLDVQARADLLASYQPFQRDARTKGIPQLGAGAVYPFAVSDLKVKDIPIPAHWRRAFGLDCALAGTTAVAWGALDPDTNVFYLTSVYRRSQAELAVHAQAIKDRGAWIPGVGDAADILDADRTSFLERFRKFGIDLVLADKAVESGIQAVFDRMSAGQFKVFESCQGFWEEFQMYRRREDGRIVKERDHVLDATRYLVFSGLQRAKPFKAKKPVTGPLTYDQGDRGSWMT